jgi:SAM-dependent methyltransferase
MDPRIRRAIPWPARLALKTAMVRLPVSYGTWRRLGLFQHGRMADPAYATRIMRKHLQAARFPTGRPFTALELGPGDSLASIVVARALGASRVWMVDVGDFASRDLDPYRAVADHLRAEGLPAPDLAAVTDFAELCAACGAEYLTDGLASLRALDSASVDFMWSHAVLEHVHRADVDAVFAELHRVLRADGVGSHRIDLRDHFADALNNLRFSEARWESPFVYRSGWYTNRLQMGPLLDAFGRAGFRTEVGQVDRWSALPTPRRRLDPAFRQLPDEDLLVKGFNVVVRRAGAESPLDQPVR